MQTFQQLKLLLAALVALAALSQIAAQQELRQADHNRVVLELPVINFTRIYNEVPRLNFGRLYSRLFNNGKEKPAQNAAKPAEGASRRPGSAERQSLRAAGSSRQVLNLQIPGGASGHQFLGGFGYGLGQAPGLGHGPYGPFGYGYPDYARIYGSSDYNSIPGVQVYPQGFGSLAGYAGFAGPDYYNYVNLNTDAVRQGYRRHGYVLQNGGFNDPRGQLYSEFTPYRQWLQQQMQLFGAQPALAQDEGLDYGEEDEEIDLASEYDNQGEDDFVDDVEEGDDYAADDELWRKANADPKVESKARRGERRGEKRGERRGEKRKVRRKAQRVAKRNVIFIN